VFIPEDVRIWDRMVEKNLTIPHRRICITHRPDVIDFMETLPLDPKKHIPGTCFVKLMHWKPDIGELLPGNILCMDLDIVLTGNIDTLIPSAAIPIKLWRNPNYGRRNAFIQGSIQYHAAGRFSEVWTDFTPQTRAWVNRRFAGAEQVWLSERFDAYYPKMSNKWNVPLWTEADGLYGAGQLHKNAKGESILPRDAKFVAFPGNRNPFRKEAQDIHPWIGNYISE
jgi:hypothetical protein